MRIFVEQDGPSRNLDPDYIGFISDSPRNPLEASVTPATEKVHNEILYLRNNMQAATFCTSCHFRAAPHM